MVLTRRACALALVSLPALGLLAPAAARADASSTYAPGSSARILAQVPGYAQTLATVTLDGLTQAQADTAIAGAESAADRRVLSLIAAPVHGKAVTTRLPVGRVLAKPPSSALADPATTTGAYVTTIKLGLNDTAVGALREQLTKPATVSPKDATATLGRGNRIKLDRGYNGSTLDAAHLPLTLIRALSTGSAVLPEKKVPAQWGAATVNKVIVVHTATNRLLLFVKGHLAQTYVVATGQAGYPSPHGSFRVIQRQGAPVWINPHDDWSMSLPDRIGPGPDDPLGTRALALNSPGILIHGIPEVENATLGQNASHGCIRMSRAAIEKLYPQIPVGTPVLLVR